MLRFALRGELPRSEREERKIDAHIRALLKFLTHDRVVPRDWETTRRTMKTRMAAVERDKSGRRRQRSLLAGTIFARSRVPLPTWFRAIGLFVSADLDGISARRLQRELDLGSNRTALDMLKQIRSLLALVRPALTDRCDSGSVLPTEIWPKLEGREGCDHPIVIEVAAQPRARRIRILYAGAKGLAGDIRPWMPPDPDEPMSGVCREVASGLVRWLRHMHRRTPAMDSIQPYLDEYAFRINIQSQRHRRDIFMALIRVATGEVPMDPFIPTMVEVIPSVSYSHRTHEITITHD